MEASLGPNEIAVFGEELAACIDDGVEVGKRSPAPVMEIDSMSKQVMDVGRETGGGYRVDVSRGERVGRVSSEWFSRPEDERFLSLDELARSVRDRAERSWTRVVETAQIQVEASRSDSERLALVLPGADAPVAPTHWSFGQLASQVGAPAAYLRQLPASLAAINLQYGLNGGRRARNGHRRK